MRIAIACALLLSGCVSYTGRYEAIGIANGNVLLLDTETGALELQEIPVAPQRQPDPRPVI